MDNQYLEYFWAGVLDSLEEAGIEKDAASIRQLGMGVRKLFGVGEQIATKAKPTSVANMTFKATPQKVRQEFGAAMSKAKKVTPIMPTTPSWKGGN